MISENMLNNFFKGTAGWLAKTGSIKEAYIEVYAVAMQAALAMILNLITTMLVGGILHMFRHSIVLLAAFIPLRSYAGGYHARGYLSCYVESSLLLAAVLIFLKQVFQKPVLGMVIGSLFAVAVIMIILWAPMADANKPLSPKETIVFRRRTCILLAAEVGLAVCLTVCKVPYGYTVMIAVILCALLLGIHKGQLFWRQRRNKQ